MHASVSGVVGALLAISGTACTVNRGGLNVGDVDSALPYGRVTDGGASLDAPETPDGGEPMDGGSLADGGESMDGSGPTDAGDLRDGGSSAAMTVNLRSAGDFVILAGTTLGNTSPSIFSGNIGHGTTIGGFTTLTLDPTGMFSTSPEVTGRI